MKKILSIFGHIVTPILGIISLFIASSLHDTLTQWLISPHHSYPGQEPMSYTWGGLIICFGIGYFICCLIPRFLTRRNAYVHGIINCVIINLIHISLLTIYLCSENEFVFVDLLNTLAILFGSLYGMSENKNYSRKEIWE